MQLVAAVLEFELAPGVACPKRQGQQLPTGMVVGTVHCQKRFRQCHCAHEAPTGMRGSPHGLGCPCTSERIYSYLPSAAMLTRGRKRTTVYF